MWLSGLTGPKSMSISPGADSPNFSSDQTSMLTSMSAVSWGPSRFIGETTRSGFPKDERKPLLLKYAWVPWVSWWKFFGELERVASLKAFSKPGSLLIFPRWGMSLVWCEIYDFLPIGCRSRDSLWPTWARKREGVELTAKEAPFKRFLERTDGGGLKIFSCSCCWKVSEGTSSCEPYGTLNTSWVFNLSASSLKSFWIRACLASASSRAAFSVASWAACSCAAWHLVEAGTHVHQVVAHYLLRIFA